MNMNTVARRVLRWIWGPNREGIVLSVLVLLTIIMSAISPAFFTVSTLFSLLRSSIVPMIYALGVLLVIISGGIDVSFAAIASFASYATIVFQLSRGINIGLVGSFAMALAIGALLGLLNGYLISRFKLPTLIVTLGTQGIFQGFLLAYIGSKYIAQLPEGMASASTANLVSVETSTGVALLHSMIIPAIILAIVIALVLSRTMFGRAIYAIGGDTESAHRAGINVKRTQIWVYVIAGTLAATAGMVYMILGRSANPQELVGHELDIIAAVVLGGDLRRTRIGARNDPRCAARPAHQQLADPHRRPQRLAARRRRPAPRRRCRHPSARRKAQHANAARQERPGRP